MSIDKELHIKFNAPLHELDTENQTYGCRQNTPDICGNNGISGICVFNISGDIVKALNNGKNAVVEINFINIMDPI